ncbi:MAG: glycerol-3-phosphate O-acyltransferase/dihydroxyacetone phosphate acyltransferase [Maribacter sp.]|jgi:glycerol-3-phosphate O-acyltransferase/dihydroxyacetone phosphate acyltransferase
MLQKLLKIIFGTALKIFFKEYKVIKKVDIPKEGPLIIVGNHPSTFMDPIIIASLMKQDVHFIAAGTFFSSNLKNWFMRNIGNSIPVHRRQDNPEMVKGNDAIFEQVFQFLEEKGTLIIFPEGTSIHERKLRNIKTGAARMALGAETRNDFKLGVKILSIGINYSHAPSFRSDVWINMEKLIHLSDFKEEHQINDRQAVSLLTNKIQKNLEKNIIITNDENEDEFIRNVENIYKNELIADLNIDPKIHSFNLTKGIQEAVHHFEDLDKKWLKKLKENVANYINQLNIHQLEDRFFAMNKKEEKSIFRDSILRVSFLVLAAPLFIYGLLTNYIPYRLPKTIAKLLTKDDSYVGPIKMTSGIFIFPLFYALWIYLFHYFISDGNGWWTVFFAISLPITGAIALFYAQRYLNLMSHIRLISLFYRQPKLIDELLEERTAIIEDLDWAKEQYLDQV